MVLRSVEVHFIYAFQSPLFSAFQSQICVSIGVSSIQLSFSSNLYYWIFNFSSIFTFSSMASFASVITLSNFHSISIKLDRHNYAFWCAQILVTIRAHNFDDLLDKYLNPPSQFLLYIFIWWLIQTFSVGSIEIIVSWVVCLGPLMNLCLVMSHNA